LVIQNQEGDDYCGEREEEVHLRTDILQIIQEDHWSFTTHINRAIAGTKITTSEI
jgi:hypothetical protein